jgi:predicted small lipoprotein YifL
MTEVIRALLAFALTAGLSGCGMLTHDQAKGT